MIDTIEMACPACGSEQLTLIDRGAIVCHDCNERFDWAEADKTGEEATDGTGHEQARLTDDAGDEDDDGMSPTPREIARNDDYWPD